MAWTLLLVTPSRKVEHVVCRIIVSDDDLRKYKIPIEYHKGRNNHILKDIKFNTLQPFVLDTC